MKLSEIYKSAAELIANGKSNRACFAIHLVLGLNVWETSDAVDWYTENILNGQEYSHILYGSDCDRPQGRRARIIALCFASAIARSEGK